MVDWICDVSRWDSDDKLSTTCSTRRAHGYRLPQASDSVVMRELSIREGCFLSTSSHRPPTVVSGSIPPRDERATRWLRSFARWNTVLRIPRDPASIREKIPRLQRCHPATLVRVLRASVCRGSHDILSRRCYATPVEGLHTETALYSQPNAVDNSRAAIARRYSSVHEVIAERRGVGKSCGEVVAKYPVQSGHIHLSWTKDGKTAFHEDVLTSMSPT